MAVLKYIGTPAQYDVQSEAPFDIVTQNYVAYLLTLNMSMPQVTTLINAALTPFATQSYANTQMAGLATPAYVTLQEEGYATFPELGQPNGPIELQSIGTILPGQINLPSTQTFPEPFWSPTSYNSAPVTASTTPQLLYTQSIPSPGYTYVVFCTGLVDTQVLANTVQVITVEGSPTGGSYTLNDWNSETTAAIAYNATAATVQTRLAALTSVGSGNVTVTGGTGGPYTATFLNTLPVSGLLDPNSTALTGGIPFVSVSSNGAYPQIFVRQGGTTGQIVAAGYGVAECYTGPRPGQTQSQLTLSSGPVLSGTLTTLSGWSAVNNSSYSTSIVGNYLQVQQTLSNVTISASIVFSGAAPSSAKGSSAVSTGIQIVTNTGAVIATGTAAVGNKGTATVDWTGDVTIGNLYGVQAIEAAATTFGTISSATLTMTPSGQTNSSTANILPTPYDQQQSLSGATTLYVMLESSDATTPVSASTFNPALWTMPIPWSLLTSPLTAVTFDSSSNGTHASLTASSVAWQQTLGVYANCLLVGVGAYNATVPSTSWTRTATCQGIPMTSLGVQQNNNSSTAGWSELFLLQDPPTGLVTIEVTLADSTHIVFVNGISVAYQGVGTVSVASANYGNAATLSAGSEASVANGTVVGLFVGGQDKVFSGPTTGTQRALGVSTATVDYCPAMFVDSPGTGSPVNLGAAWTVANNNSSLVVSLTFAP